VYSNRNIILVKQVDKLDCFTLKPRLENSFEEKSNKVVSCLHDKNVKIKLHITIKTIFGVTMKKTNVKGH